MCYHRLLGRNKRLSLVWKVQAVVKNGCVREGERVYGLLLLVVIDFCFVCVSKNGAVKGEEASWGNEKDALSF